MNADRLFALYDRVADAPGAVARLRRFVLDLAVRGRLAEQDPEDEPAPVLLERIAAEKARLVEAKEIRKPKPVSELEPDDLPFVLPHSWTWTQIAQLGVISPRNDASDELTASFVPMSMISAQYGVANSHEPCPWREIKKGYTHFAEGDIGLAKITPCFENGKSTIFEGLTGGLGAGTTELHVVRPLLVDANYIVLFLKSPHFIETGIQRMTGTAGQKRVPTEYFTSSPFPLPPLPEQHRIVARVEEVMALLDRLEAARNVREATRDRLTAAGLVRLTAADTAAEDVPAHARFALDALPVLTTGSDQIKLLRQTILNLAVRGKLVEQDPADEPASTLLERIVVAKIAAKHETGDARIKPAPTPDPDALPWELPFGWSAESFENLFLFIDYRGKTPPKTENGVPLITAKNIRMGNLNRDPREFVSEITFGSWMTRGLPKFGDLFFTTEAPLANVCLNDIEGSFALAQRVVCLQPYAEINTRYIMIAIMSDFMRNLIDERSTGLTAKGIKTAKLKPLPIPVPPLVEQHRIVARVDSLMKLCNQLESALQKTDTARTLLLDALIHEVLSPAALDARETAA